MHTTTSPDTAQILDQNITYEFLCVLGIENRRILSRFARLLVHKPVDIFAQMAAEFDAAVGQQGLGATAEQYLEQIVAGFSIDGQDNIPLQGPVIIASNHPGSVDILLLLAGIHRKDVRIIASGAPFLKSLPNISPHLLFSTSNAGDRLQALRGALRHLLQGGCLVTFPTGLVDPDPAFMPEAPASFDRWHASLALLMKKIPACRLVPAVVSGVLEPKYYHHPLTRFFRDPIRRQKFAEYWMVIQILRKRPHFDLTPQASFGTPFLIPAGAANDMTIEPLMADITYAAKELLTHHTERLYPQFVR